MTDDLVERYYVVATELTRLRAVSLPHLSVPREEVAPVARTIGEWVERLEAELRELRDRLRGDSP